ncbi:MAG: Kdo hydroxylase family protein [Terriglobales bacterium]
MTLSEPCVAVVDFRHPEGWVGVPDPAARACSYCRQLEEGRILLFSAPPFALPQEDRDFLLGRRQTGSRLHKNISYKPSKDQLSGFSSEDREQRERAHRILQNYSAEVTRFLAAFLLPYRQQWKLDYASFRPLEEKGRELPLHKRNDLLHVDAFPSRPTRGARILRVFTNLNPAASRVWRTGEPFHVMASQWTPQAGLARRVARSHSPLYAAGRGLRAALHALRLPVADRSSYDEFMLHFHDWLKENTEYQQQSPQAAEEFSPNATWLVYTDGVPHAVLSGQFALEQTYIIPRQALVAPEAAPIEVLQKLCGVGLA